MPEMQTWLERFVGAIPWSWRRSIYRHPAVARLARRILNRLVGRGRKIVAITAGPLKGARFRLDLQTEKYFWLGTHEPLVQEWLASYVKPGWVVYDVGAHIGFFTLLLSRLVGESGKVFAFEPDPANAKRLRENTSLNNTANVRLVPQAVSGDEGMVRFQSDRETMSHVVTGTHSGGTERAGIIEVSATTLDTFVIGGHNPPPHFIKLDVEGHEDVVLSGSLRILKEHRPLILCEVHNAHAGVAVWTILTSLNYRLFPLDNSVKQLETRSDLVAGHYIALP
ncbi:MAG TPA: FkbM family methyltransferase [Chloroflexia bacterium]|nr:FkbM family methyltransferase [Chloroflexia bacterium]